MRIPTTFIAALFVGLLVSAESASAQGHTIRGKVRKAAGVNIGRTSVTLEKNGAMVNQTVTNNEGDFTFTGLTDTSYTVVVAAVDYNPVSESVDFVRDTSSDQPGEVRTVEVTLVPVGGIRPPRPGFSFVQDIPPAALAAFQGGLKLARENRVADALAAYESAIKIFPDYFNARFVLAGELARQGNFSDAIKHLDEARRVNPKDDRVYELFARVMMQQRKYAVAARIYAEAARLNPSEPQYLLAQGTALVEQASTIDKAKSAAAAEERTFALTEAEKTLIQVSRQNKKLAEVHLQLARVYEKIGDRARATAELEQYLRKAPGAKNADAIRNAIKSLRESKQ
ncbi:MAG: tetratricopeptide repeat protein [Pyrinomonadaceae bacterium]